MDDKAQIRELTENWVLYRDAGHWRRFASVWHEDGWMTATWFQGTARRFIDASKAGFEAGVRILHLLGGHTSDLADDRAVAQTKMTILQRGPIDGVMVDVTCVGRFYDFLERRDGRWAIVRRQPIYETDRLDVVEPGRSVELDAAVLAGYPEGYRYLAYLQEQLGHRVMPGLPGLTGAAVERLYREGASWLQGSATAGIPLTTARPGDLA